MGASKDNFTINQILKIFNSTKTPNTIKNGIESGKFPQPKRIGKNQRRVWELKDLPIFGESLGFLEKPNEPVVATIFALKGGVLKTTLTLNLARVAALNNIKTCVVGLDMQCDVTRALDSRYSEHQYEDLNSLEAVYADIQGLSSLQNTQNQKITVDDLILKSDLPTLDYIPETPDLVLLERSLHNLTRREDWIKRNLLPSLKEKYDMIVFDCPPNWNLLTGAALVASNVLISPVECQPGGWGNAKMFINFIQEFKKDAQTDFHHISVPTKFAISEKLSPSIKKYYIQNIPGCTVEAIRISVASKEAFMWGRSLLEFKPNDDTAAELTRVVQELWTSVIERVGKETKKSTQLNSQNSNRTFTQQI